MFPPTSVFFPLLARISPTSVVVVVLPFDPVIASTLPFKNRNASSTSPITGIPSERACCNCGWSEGTPGLTTIKS